MTFQERCSVVHAIECKYLCEALETFNHYQFYKRRKKIILDHYDVPFCEQQYTHVPCYIFLFKFKSFDQFNPSDLPRILDIYSVVVL